MTVTDIEPFETPLAVSAAVTEYTFRFGAEEENHVQAQIQYADGTLVDLTQPADYTVVLDTENPGGTIVLTAAAAATYDGAEIVSYRVTPNTQPVVLPNQGPFFAETLESMSDRLTRQVQETDYNSSRSLRIPIGQTAGIVVPGPAGTVPLWDAEGNLLGTGPSANDITAAGDDAQRAEDAANRAEAAAGSNDLLHASTRTIMAAADPGVYVYAYLREEGRTGFFRLRNLLEVATWQAVDTAQMMFVLSTHADGAGLKVWERVGTEPHNLAHAGLKADGTINVNDKNQHPNYGDAAAVQAADVVAGTKYIIVSGTPYQLYDDDHTLRLRNQITNSGFDQDTDWTRGTGWTISGGVANAAPGAQSNLQQNPSGADAIVAGVQYAITGDVVVNAGSFTPQLGAGGVGETNVSTSGRFHHVVTAGTGGQLIITKFAGFDGTIDNLQVRRVPQGAVQSNDGAWWHPFNPTYDPYGDGATTGTDNLENLRSAVNLMALTKRPCYLPSGTYRCQVTDVEQTSIIEVGAYFHIFGDGKGAAKIIMDDNRFFDGTPLTNGQLGNIFFGSRHIFDETNYSRDADDVFYMRGFTLHGTWWREMEGLRDRTWTAGTPYRLHAFGASNCADVWIDDFAAIDVLGFWSRSRSNASFVVTNSLVQRVCGDGIRGEDCPRYIVDRNTVIHCDDDSITNPDLDDRPNDLGPRRSGAVVTNNTIIGAEGPLILGPAGVLFEGNRLFRTYGTGLSAFAINTDSANRGEGGFRNVIIRGNIIEDHMRPSQRATNPDGTWGLDTDAVNVNGAIATALSTANPIGEGAGTPADTDPWHTGDFLWGAMHLQDMVGLDDVYDEASGARGHGLIMGQMVIRRTLGEAERYSDWGYGRRFTRWGFDNPEVLDEHFAENAIRMGGQFDGVLGHNLEISGFRAGACVQFDNANTSGRYKNVHFNDCMFTDCQHGFDADAAGGAHSHDITIRGGVIDCDPYRRSSDRAAGNRWAVTSANAPTGVHLSFLRGVTIDGVTFKNCANMWTLEGGAIENPEFNTILNCIGIVNFGEAGANTTHPDNESIGRIPVVSKQVTYQVRDLDPASATFDHPIEGMRVTGGARPTTGKYVTGHIHRSGASFDERLTTGSGHVGGTDWTTL